ncbi:MAG: type II toxin-antitoxin system VapC family toxin [Actinomycetota bacterium]|nr:type II toxin-antitoxin system VapC family toxin [Actinomycetota bacterium]
MITALDTDVLVDVVGGDHRFGPSSLTALNRAGGRGSLVVCDVVWGEVSSVFPDLGEARRALRCFEIEFSPMSQASAERAGEAWRAYRRAGGRRERLVADFLIAGHATEQADILLTRDRGFARSHFGGLRIEDPSAEV